MTRRHLESDASKNKKRHLAEILKEMFNALEQRIPQMGLEDDQEELILSAVDNSIHRVLGLQDKGADYASSLKLVLGAIQHLTGKQSDLVEQVFIKEESFNNFSVGEDDSSELGVDLFWFIQRDYYSMNFLLM